MVKNQGVFWILWLIALEIDRSQREKKQKQKNPIILGTFFNS